MGKPLVDFVGKNPKNELEDVVEKLWITGPDFY